MVHIRVLLFAHLREAVGQNHLAFSLPQGSSVRDLKQVLQNRYPELGSRLDNIIVAVNQVFADDGDLLEDGAEVALFPPVSGGALSPTIVAVTDEAFDLNVLVAQIVQPNTGAVCVFTGIVRGETQRGNPHQTVALEYEAYIPMAEAKMRQIADEIRQRWPNVEGIAMIQRVGRLQPGSPTVAIACAAAHRDMGVFEAARYGIDRLKEIVPVWKKEIGPLGETWVEGHYHPERGE
ncbi:molybdopterin converting factor subunit 1 [uncultured Thermanaerothrix sp.]|uniref:molybdopterin converting factor subunit 1 n=1 Tax=uncultured Thermanaerothrix sp. TaxID=1195149 RepID=UPI00262D8B51|nr:molybdopterin converting factor subunit 1 [uncultured Thermanaerothrix sp.]